MANEKISAFNTVEDGQGTKPDVRKLKGIAGYEELTVGSGVYTNAQMSGEELVESIINQGSAAQGRISFYGAGSGGQTSLGGSSGLSWDQTTDTLNIGTPNSAAGLEADVRLHGTYVTSDGQPSISFYFGDSSVSTTPNIFTIITDKDGSDQTWVLPTELPDENNALVALDVDQEEVTLGWATNFDTQYTFSLEQSTVGSNESPDLKLGWEDSTGTQQEYLVQLIGGTNITTERNTTGDELTINATPSGLQGQIQFASSTDTFTADSSFFYTLGTNVGNLAIGDVGVTQGRIALYGGPSNSGAITISDPNDDGVTITVPNDLGGSNYDIILPSDEPANNQILETDASGNLSWIDTPGGGGGNSVQTLTTLTWDYDNGNSAIFTPTDNGTNPIDVLVATNFPSGARGSLKVIPTNTIKFGLFTNSKLPSSQNILQISAVNPTILHYFYDGTTFYWFYDINYIDPVNQSPDPNEPTVGGSNLLGFWFPGSTSFADGANISLGDTWTQSLPSPGPGLIGNLTRVGTSTGSSGMKYFARDAATEQAPYWDFIGDVAWESTVATPGGGSSIDDWGISFYFKATSDTSTTSYMGIADPNTNDAEAIYLESRELTIFKGSSYVGIQGNFPKFTSGNNLEDEWVFCHIDVLQGANIVICYIGTQASFNASTSQGGSGTITGEDGTAITLEASGLYATTTAVANLNDSGMSTIIYGAAKSSGGTVYQYKGHLGLVAFYNGQLAGAQVTNNWNDTREFYYID